MRTGRVISLTALLVSISPPLYGADAKAPLPVPFEETFAASKLDSAWTTHVLKGNAIEVKDGALEIRAREGSRAHIERSLNVDSVRIACAIRPTEGAAAAFVFVCWDDENSCQLGVSANRIHAWEVLGTYGYDYDLGAWPAGAWRSVAIELTKDCIRYLVGDDGGELKCLRVAHRPERFAAVPTLLVVGQGAETKLFPRPNLYVNPPPSETFGTAYVRDLRVTKLEPGRVEASAADKAALLADERDTLGEQELASSDDPTFESVSRHWPRFKWPREVIGVKDHPHAIGVGHDGALQFSDNIATYGEPTGSFEIGAPAYRFGTGPTPCLRRLLNGYLPVVILTDRHDGLELEQTAFGYAKDLSPDEPLLAYARLKVTNTGETARTVALRWCVAPASESSPALSWQLDVLAGSSRVVDLKAPFTIRKSPAVEAAAGEFDGKLAEVTAYWDRLLAPGSRFEVPEQRVQDAYRAWLAYNFINVHKRGSVYHVCDGSGFYAEVYGTSAALYCIKLDMLGYHDLAARNLDSLLTFMKPNGLLEVNSGDTDTGAALCAMRDHYRFTRDADWLRRMAPKMLTMCGWIIEARKQALAAAASQPAVARGMIRHKPYADLLHPAADYWSNGYLCKGLAAAADALTEIGMTEEAARLRKESERYLNDLKVSMDGAVFTDGGMKILPVMPDTRELWKESNGSANGYYSLMAPLMLESDVPAWNDPKADLLIDALRRRSGLALGVSRFHDLIDHAYTYGYWMTCLRRNDVKPVILGLYASMAVGMTWDTYAAIECHAIRSGENYRTLPHTYSNTQQIRLLRNMLLREEGDDLLLGSAIPRPWLADGKRVAVKQAPTFFGPVSYAIDSHTASGTIDVRIEPPTRGDHKAVKLRLRHPAATSIKGIECKPDVKATFKDDVIEFPSLKAGVDVTVRY